MNMFGALVNLFSLTALFTFSGATWIAARRIALRRPTGWWWVAASVAGVGTLLLHPGVGIITDLGGFPYIVKDVARLVSLLFTAMLGISMAAALATNRHDDS